MAGGRAVRRAGMLERSAGGSADQTRRRTAIGTAPRGRVAAGGLAAVSWMADSEAAGVPMPLASAGPRAKVQAGFEDDASPPLGERMAPAVEGSEPRAAKDCFAIASVACFALGACVTAIFLVFALP